MAENTSKIVIVSEYHDMSSEPIKASMAKSAISVGELEKAFGSLKRSVAASMGATRKSINESMQGAVDSLKKLSKEQNNLGDSMNKGGRQARTFGAEIGKFAGQVGSMRNMILVYLFMLRPFVDSFKAIMKATQEQEDALKRLNDAMLLQGNSSKYMGENLMKLAGSLQQVTRYGDESIMSVMEKLMSIGNVLPSQLQRVTQAVMDFSTATGKDLETSAMLFAKAAEGITVGFSRYGLAIDKNIPKTRILDEVLTFAEKHWGGRAQKDAETFSGQIAIMSNNFDELKESLGKIVIEGLQLPKVIQYWKELLQFYNLSVQPKTPISYLSVELEKVKKQIVEFATLYGRTVEELSTEGPIKSNWFNDLFGFTGKTGEASAKARDLLIQRKNLTAEMERQAVAEAKTKHKAITEADELAIVQKRIKTVEQFNDQWVESERKRVSYAKQVWQDDYKNFRKAIDEKIALDKVGTEEYKKNLDDKFNLEILNQRKIEELRKQQIAENRRNPRMEDWQDSVASLKEYLSPYGQAYVEVMTETAHSAEKALSDGFVKVIKGDFESLQDVVADFGDAMIGILAQVAAKSLLVSIGMSSFMGIAHTGGYIYSKNPSYGGSEPRKFHSGGEVPATLLEGEYVMNRNAVRNVGVGNLDRLNRGESAGGGETINNYYIQAIDVKSFRDRLEQNGDIYANASEMNIRNNGSLRKTNMSYA